MVQDQMEVDAFLAHGQLAERLAAHRCGRSVKRQLEQTFEKVFVAQRGLLSIVAVGGGSGEQAQQLVTALGEVHQFRLRYTYVLATQAILGKLADLVEQISQLPEIIIIINMLYFILYWSKKLVQTNSFCLSSTPALHETNPIYNRHWKIARNRDSLMVILIEKSDAKEMYQQ
jgi:hypothetical protein